MKVRNYEHQTGVHGAYNLFMSFISPPVKIPFLLKLGILISEKVTGRMMLPPRILAWYPKAAIGSGIMEALVAHEDGRMDKRMLKLIRMAASYAVACPFCVDMNSYEYRSSLQRLWRRNRKRIWASARLDSTLGTGLP